MYNAITSLIIFLFSFCTLCNINANKINISNIVFHHLSDSHIWRIIGSKNDSFNIIVNLPIILFDHYKIIFLKLNDFYNNSLHVAKKKNEYYVIINDVIYRSNALGNIMINNKGEIINNRPIDLSITKNVMSIFLSSLIMLIMFIFIADSYNKYYLSKYRLGGVIDFVIVFIRDYIVLPNFGSMNCNKFLPFFLTLFFYILVNNLFGLLPIGVNITGNYNVSLCLSFVVFIFCLFNSSTKFWKHIFYPKNIPFTVRLFIIPIELISLVIKPLTLCIRLFSNITAGHIISIVLISLIFVFNNIFFIFFSIIFSIFIYLLEFFVSFLQAFIFTYLSAIFISNAVN
jgi:F-type H+-transporting ATPase subunit a